MNNDPNRPAGQALNTAGLTRAFSETAGLDGRSEIVFPEPKLGWARVTCLPQPFYP